MPPAPTSPRITQLKERIARGDTSAISQLFARLAVEHTPIIEALPTDTARMLTTFIVRDTTNPKNLLLMNGAGGWSEPFMQFERIAGTDVWFKTVILPKTIRIGYRFVYNPTLQPFYLETVYGYKRAPGYTDPLNPPSEPAGPGVSIVAGPNAASQPWSAFRAATPRGRLDTLNIPSKILGVSRGVYVYTPAAYESRLAKETLPVLIVFDGDAFTSSRSIPTPVILDNLISERKIQPVIGVFVRSAGGNRMQELGCDSTFSAFVATELLPAVKSRYRITDDAAKTVVGGSSQGGLGATCAALFYPRRFGNVISQSASFWWAPDNDPEDEWPAREFARRPRMPVRFYVEVGTFETVHNPGFGPGQVSPSRHFRDVLIAKGNDVVYNEFPGGHEYFNWRGTLPNAIMHFFPP